MIFLFWQYNLICFLVSSLDIRFIILLSNEILDIVFVPETIPLTTFINKICLIFSLSLSLFIISIIPSIHLFITFFFKSSLTCNSFILSLLIKKLINKSKQKNLSLLNFPFSKSSKLILPLLVLVLVLLLIIFSKSGIFSLFSILEFIHFIE